ncbi:MAG: HlyD family efflux transporter periplasmic adaptor subunit [Bacteroidota bacterium]
MDKKIEKKKWSQRKTFYLMGGLMVLALSAWGYSAMSEKVYKLSLDSSGISIRTAERAEFQDIILIDGTLEPISSVLVNTPEGGTVEKVFIEDGVVVKAGTPLLKLANPSVMLGYMTQETAIVEQMNNLQNLKLALDKDQRTLQESLIDIQYQLQNDERDFKVDTLLFEGGVIPENDFLDSQDDYKYRVKKKDFLQDNVNVTGKNNEVQLRRINRSLELMERNLEVIHENMERLQVKAPVTGRLSSFDPVIGESFSPNQTIAKIDVLKGYKVKGQVNEFYLSQVKPGQRARFSFDGDLVELEVKKVLPEVIAGNFEIDLIFVEKAPEAIRTGLSVQVRLELSEASMAVKIPRGAYFHSSGGQFVYVVGPEKKEAYKRTIRIGRMNPSYYEVLEGLEEGESIITSSYEAYKDYEKIILSQ